MEWGLKDVVRKGGPHPGVAGACVEEASRSYFTWCCKGGLRKGHRQRCCLGSGRESRGQGAGVKTQRQEGLRLVVGRGGVMADGVSIHGVLCLSGDGGELWGGQVPGKA